MLPEKFPSDNHQHGLSATADADADAEKLNKLVEQFSDFIKENGKDVLSSLEQQNTPQNAVTLFDLFSELSAIKNEVKRESKQVKDAVGQFTGLLDTLKQNNQQLSTELEHRQQQDEKTSFAYRLPLLEDVLDLNDSLQHTLESAKRHKPSWWERRSKRALFFRQDMIKGLEITQRRINKMLQKHHIKAIPCVGKTLDPHKMKAVKLVKSPKYKNGQVLAEIRKGYTRDNDVIRLAEVVVNKT